MDRGETDAANHDTQTTTHDAAGDRTVDRTHDHPARAGRPRHAQPALRRLDVRWRPMIGTPLSFLDVRPVSRDFLPARPVRASIPFDLQTHEASDNGYVPVSGADDVQYEAGGIATSPAPLFRSPRVIL